MAGLRFALSILVVAAALLLTHAQVLMVPPMIHPMSHPSHPHHMEHLIQPVQITGRADYVTPKEPLDEERLQQRMKELEASKQALRQKQIDLDEKIAILHEEALRCEKQISIAQQEIHKLEELERFHYLELVRLERLIEQQRMAEYQEKLHQERLSQQRAIEEMNRNEELQRSASRKEPYEANDDNGTFKARIGEGKSEIFERRSNESGKDIRTRLPGRSQNNERPDLTLMRSKPSVLQGTFTTNLQAQIVPRVKHVIEKKEVHGEPPKEAQRTNGSLEIVNEAKVVPLVEIHGTNKTESTVSSIGSVTDASIDHPSTYKNDP